MSDTSFEAIVQSCAPQNFIDDTWAEESLSDDEIELPKDIELNTEDHVEGGDDDDEDDGSSEDAWKEEGLEKFSRDHF